MVYSTIIHFDLTADMLLSSFIVTHVFIGVLVQ